MNCKQVNFPLVSVIMPTYNHAQFIGNAIESVLSQSYKNIEVIVVDNYSEDNTLKEIRSFQDNRINYYRFRNNGIIAASRNYGIRKSKGDVIAFLDSDDIWYKDKLKKQLKYLLIDGITCVATNYILIGNRAQCRNNIKFAHGELYKDYTYDDLVVRNVIVNSSVIISKDIILELGGLDENPVFIAIEDWDLWLRASKKGKVRVLSEKLVKYRRHVNNYRDKRDVHLRSFNILEKHQSLGYLNDALMKAAFGSRYLLLGKASLDVNDWQGVKYYKRALIRVKGLKNKLRAIIGIIIFYVPKDKRSKVINMLHSISLIMERKMYYKWSFRKVNRIDDYNNYVNDRIDT